MPIEAPPTFGSVAMDTPNQVPPPDQPPKATPGGEQTNEEDDPELTRWVTKSFLELLFCIELYFLQGN